MKLTKIAMSAVLVALVATAAHSQTYKADFSTKLVLPSAGNDPTNLFTITSGTLTGPLSWTLPTTAGGSGYVLSTNGSGVLSWVAPTTSVTLGGDVTGASGSNAIATLAGNDIVAAINAGTTSTAINAPVGITGTSLTASSGGTISTTGAINGGTGTFTGAASAVGLTSTGGLTTSAGAANLSTTDASAVNLGTGSFANPIGIGNGDGVTLPYSTTTIAGKVNFTGTVSLPNGSVTAASIGLTTNDLMVGDGSGHGSALATADNGVLVTDGTGVPSISTTLPNGLTMNNATIGGTTSISTSGAIATTSTLNAGAATVTSLDAGSGAITTTGTLGAGAATVTSLNAGAGTIQTTGAIDGNTGTFTGGLTTSGGTANINSALAGSPQNTNIDASPATGGANVIGNSTSTTALDGAVTFNGTVTLPNGSVSLGSLSLADGDIIVGNAGNASGVAMSGDASIDNTGHITVTKFNGTTFGTMAGQDANNVNITGGSIDNSALAGSGTLTVTAGSGLSGGGSVALGASSPALTLDVTHANTWTGTQTLGGVAYSSSTITATNPTQADWGLSTSNSYFLVSSAAATTVSGIAGGAAGRVIVLVNTGSSAITLSNANGTSAAANQFHFQGNSDVLMAQDGTVTLIYDATYNSNVGAWRMISGQ